MYTYIHTHLYIHVYVYICNGILLSHEKNEILPFVTMWMVLDSVILSEVSQRKTLYVITYMRNLKNKTNLYYKTETDSQM